MNIETPEEANVSGRLNRWLSGLQQQEDQLFLILTILIGALVGLVIVAFILLTERIGSKMYPAGGAPWRRLVVPVAGSLITGYLLRRFFPDARGSGIPQTKVALFVQGGRIRMRTIFGRFLCSSASLASGIALGREGPSVQLGGGIASVIGQKLGLGPQKLKALIPVGAAASLAAAFNTPISAVLFSLEEVMGDLHAPVLGSVVLGSAISWVVLHLFLGDEPLFHVPGYQLVHPVEFLIYAALGVLGGLCSVAFVKLTLFQRKHFLRLPESTRWFQPVAGGLTVGILGWFVPGVLGVGYDYVGQVLNGEVALKLVALLIVLKLVATATCYASGNAGGIFGPSLFLGAMVGGTVGSLVHQWFPSVTGTPGAYALVGMGCTFAGIIRTPLTSVFMIFELTRDYTIVVPLMIANLISFYLSYRLQRQPIYEALAEQDGIHLPHGAAAGRRNRRAVHQVMRAKPEMIGPNVPIADLPRDPAGGAYLIGEEDTLWGLLPREAVEEARDAGGLVSSLLRSGPNQVESVDAENFPHVHLDHSLEMALDRMGALGVGILPVADRANVRRVKGVILLDDVIRSYSRNFSEPRGKT